jgi:uncharacterized membrane protein YedE/YeeE
MAALVVSCFLAAILGFAAHRASVCTVRGVAEVMSTRRAYMLVSIGKSMLTLPFFWLVSPANATVSGWHYTGFVLLGGFTFGLGAGINGACAYATMTRMVDGEAGMMLAVAGFVAGIYVFTLLLGAHWVARPTQEPARVASLLPWAAALTAALVAWAVYEAARLWRTRPPGAGFAALALARQYRLSSAAMLIGIAGAAIFLLFGSPGYTTTFQQVVEGVIGTRPYPATGRWVLLLAVLAGMAISTAERRGFRIDWTPRRSWLRNIVGGVLMGLGVALAPGGNDALVLYGIPSLSPHALPAFLAMAAGIAVALYVMRSFFGIHWRVECRNDLYFADASPPGDPTKRA